MSRYEIEIRLEGLPPINSADAPHRFVRHKARKLWKRLIWASVVGRKPEKPLSHARVHITRCSSAPPDPANLGEGAKFLLDGLVDAGVLEDDSARVIGMPKLDWEMAPPKKGHVRIRVWEPDVIDNRDAWERGPDA